MNPPSRPRLRRFGCPARSVDAELLGVLGVQSLPAAELHGLGADDASNGLTGEKPIQHIEVMEILVGEHEFPIRRACRAVGLSRTAWYRRPEDHAGKDREVVDALQGVLEKRPRWGFWKCYDRLRLDGRQWNHKRVRRMYRSLGLNLPRRTKRRPPRRPLQILEAPATLNRVWALDFMHDRLYGSGRSFRTLNVVDEANRKGLAIEVGTSIPAARVVRVMEQLDEMYGLPSTVRVDNGPEFLAEAFQSWCLEHGIEIRFIQPGKPNQNAYVERFNKSYREEILDAYLFETSTRRSSSRTSGCSTTTTSGRTTRSEDSLRRATCRGPQPWIRLLSRCVLDGDTYAVTATEEAGAELSALLVAQHHRAALRTLFKYASARGAD